MFKKRSAGLIHSINDETGDRTLATSGRSTLIEGKDKIIEELLGLSFEISMKSFFQTNPKSAEKLFSAVNKAKGNPIHRLLHSLSIHHLGKKASKLIAAEINHVFDLQYWDKEKFTSIKDIGPVVADNVIAYFSDLDHIAMLHRIEEHGVNMKQTKEDRPLVVSEDAPLSGKTILFTGSLQLMGRKEAQKLAEQNGAKNISAVSSNLNILVAGEKAGSKLKKAQALGSVLIMTEEEFVALIEK